MLFYVKKKLQANKNRAECMNGIYMPVCFGQVQPKKWTISRDRIQKIKVRNIRLLSMQYDAADFSEQNDTSIIHIGQREV